jgi:hypothetical protein
MFLSLIVIVNFPEFDIEMTSLNPELNVNPLDVFSNDIIDHIYISIKESEIMKSKQNK